jgi:hypothetical protein
MLDVSLRKLQKADYRFCDSPTCEVVYFSSEGAQSFTLADVRVRVYPKEFSADVPICYCFQHTLGALQSSASQMQAIYQDIVDGIREGNCACNLRNPQGSCCLGNVQAIARRQP